ncbi:hypothetical protein L596_006277 [Steinernema carpocapsae]|uniref:Uncharacterized protein n=1 Tax=Steinernema carpocapsae TaxID=34508 RepID=A0A4U8V3F1_STECR|nr:hypothetical protein L596_006277 [Steinernema carpocapsae]
MDKKQVGARLEHELDMANFEELNLDDVDKSDKEKKSNEEEPAKTSKRVTQEQQENIRTLFRRANICWRRLHRVYVQHLSYKVDTRATNGFDAFVMLAIWQTAQRIDRENCCEILRATSVPLFVAYVAMGIFEELADRCGAEQTFANLQRRFPAQDLVNLFISHWNRAALEQEELYLAFMDVVKVTTRIHQAAHGPQQADHGLQQADHDPQQAAYNPNSQAQNSVDQSKEEKPTTSTRTKRSE